jgi:uncharacterized repeat protein (TIGR03803 family)
MKSIPLFRPMICAMLTCLILLVSSTNVLASLKYQVLQSLGKPEGTPRGKLVQGSDGYFYGTTYYGGSQGAGTVFKISSTGSFSVLHEFDGAEGGKNPQAGLIQASDGYFYGTTVNGGGSGAGAVFKISSSGSFTVVHEFDGAEGGANPHAGLIQANDGNFYGTTFSGGSNSLGTVFKVDPSGNFSVLHAFSSDNNYASFPQGGVIQGNDGNLYGTTSQGGSYSNGNVFKLDLSGNFTVLHEFEAGINGDNNYGSYPLGALVQASDGSFYGTTNSYNSYDAIGTVYKIDTSGNFTHLTTLNGQSHDGLVQANDGKFYITTYPYGFPDAYGEVYKMDSLGNLTSLHEFTGGSGGENPYAALTQGSDGSLYGTTANGGSDGSGIAFKLDLSGNFQVLGEFKGTPVLKPNNLTQDSEGNFYVTSTAGGSYGYNSLYGDGFGTVFQWDTSENVTILHSFDGYTDAAYPNTVMPTKDGSLYGTTHGGYIDYWFTDYVSSTLFKIDPAGNFSTLHTFDYSEGFYVDGDLIQAADGSIYGTAFDGGSNGYGTVFKVDPASGSLAVVHDFDEATGGTYFGLIQNLDGNLYGTTYGSVSNNAGIVYKLDLSGNFSVLHEFDGAGGGSKPKTPLIQDSEGNMYGTTEAGGSHNAGVVYRLDLSGNFSVLYEFNESQVVSNLSSFVRDTNGNFYGTVLNTPDDNNGFLFKLDALGNFTTIHSFNDTDGYGPLKLIQVSDGSFYGITQYGGEYGGGVIFRLAENTQPVADAGSDQTVTAGTLVSLDGTGSSDPDNGPSPLTYNWTQTSGLTVTLADADTAQPSFTPQNAGTYVFSLVVNDGDVGSIADSVSVTVKDSSSANTAPTAHAGSDQTVNAGSLVTLNGSTSSDPDHGPSPLTYQWSQTGGPSVALKGSTTAQPTFTPLEPGTYGFSLVVNDGEDSSTADSVTVTVNDADYVLIQSPNGGEVWNEKSKQTITWISRNLDSKLRLALFLSIDNGQTWKKIASPKNSGSRSWKVPMNRYVSKQALFKICVKQNEALCDVSDAVFTINKSPKAEAGKKQKVTVGTEVRLDGSASVDADHGPSPLTYRWTQTSGPKVTLIRADTATPSFTPTVKGSYRFSLVVNDGAIDSKADKVTVRVQKAP